MAVSKSQEPSVIDYRSGKPIPAWVRDLIAEQMAMEQEDARSAGTVGFMSRALVMASMPYKDPKKEVFSRANGDFKLRIMAGYEGGIPYGIYPRLLMSWVTTEAVRYQSPELELGESLGAFLRAVVDVRATGGSTGTLTRVNEQMKRLFGSMITASYSGANTSGKTFSLRNVMIVDEADIDEDEMSHLGLAKSRPKALAKSTAGAKRAKDNGDEHDEGDKLWTPQQLEEAGKWKSRIRLSENFFRECLEHPVPIDLRAYKGLRGSPLAMDLYAWLTHRMFYITRKTRLIRYEMLMVQFGSGYAMDVQGKRDFKKNFLRALQQVLIVYPQAKVQVEADGIFLLPSPTHIPNMRKGQLDLLSGGG